MNRQMHFNPPQMRSIFVSAPVEWLVAGRGTGKSEGVLAYKSAQCYFKTMPRGTGVTLGATYNQLLTRTLPALVYGWEKIGYRLNEHYLIGQRPSQKWIKKWNWKGPYRPPLEYKYFTSWFNGGGAHLVSQDRKGSSNGITIDWIIGDEAKLLNEEKFKTELIPANRGKIIAFKDNIYHHGMTFTTDMPVGTAGRWILDMSEKSDKEKVKQILNLQAGIYQLKQHYPSASKPVKLAIDEQIAIFNDELKELRTGLLYYHEASTIENIHALGIDYIKQQLRDTTQFQFDTQILNIRPMRMENGFYPDLDEEYHGYFANNDSYLERLDYNLDAIANINCMRDSDLNFDKPLHISIDYNRRIHPMTVAQVDGEYLKVIKGLHALYPAKLKELIDLFDKYYKPHRRKLVYYWHDHTAVGDDNETKKADVVIGGLRKRGWIVIPMYMGQAPSHEAKYRMWGDLLSENGYYKLKFRVNRENADKYLLSMCLTQAEAKKDGFGKNKKSEHDPNFPAEESTHYSDAGDMLVYGILESGLSYGERSTTGDMILTG
ncbi:hypothetical protein ACFOWM_03485 [Ferruginibacter yonginensis]|uniref:Terminase-like family protein n=1 Tax=Ferruginibacter yonginensis TaxID=1310416 RepID=A0ABV8QQ82_9BACT